MGDRVIVDSENSWGQLFDSKSGRITVTGSSSLHNGVIYSSKELRFNRKVHRWVMLEAYAEYGAIGVIVLLFVGQIMFLQRTLMSKLKDTDDKVVGLINRWNRSDEVRDRRHEDLLKEMNDQSDDLAYLKGRINGKWKKWREQE